MKNTQPGRLIVISGPSGAGKSTVVRQLIQDCDLPLVLSVSATTRQPREGEIDGQHYFFLTKEEFERRRQAGDFLEYKEVFSRGHWYGTLREQVASGLKAGQWVILEIDVQGAMSVIEQADLNPITLFIDPGSLPELERRLRDRGTESDADIAARLATAKTEIEFRKRYQHYIVNDTVESAVKQICQILQQPSN